MSIAGGASSLQRPSALRAGGDATRRWPDDRSLIELGVLRLRRLAGDEDAVPRRIGFLPTRLVDGIEPPSDPLFAARGDVYRAAYAARN